MSLRSHAVARQARTHGGGCLTIDSAISDSGHIPAALPDDSAGFLAWTRSLSEEFGGGRPIYRSYSESWNRLRTVVRPGGAVAHCLGESNEGQPIWAFTVRDKSARSRPVVVIAGLHAMEHIGVASAIALLERAVGGSVWRDRPLTVLPMANPDGFLAVQRARARGRIRFQRRNARAVDLNRNFSEFWRKGSLFAPLFAAGSAPLSEPETRAVDRLGQLQPEYFVSLHAFGEVIFYPYAGTRARAPDAERLAKVAVAMAAAQERPYKTSQLGRYFPMFLARGAEIDHFYSRYGTLSFLIEIGSGPKISQPKRWFSPYAWFNPSGVDFAADVENAARAVECLAAL